jgi:hypothetical protein
MGAPLGRFKGFLTRRPMASESPGPGFLLRRWMIRPALVVTPIAVGASVLATGGCGMSPVAAEPRGDSAASDVQNVVETTDVGASTPSDAASLVDVAFSDVSHADPSDGGVQCGDRRCAAGELCQALTQICGLSSGCPDAGPVYGCFAVPDSCKGHAAPTCACAAAAIGLCAQPNPCVCSDTSTGVLSCTCDGA